MHIFYAKLRILVHDSKITKRREARKLLNTHCCYCSSSNSITLRLVEIKRLYINTYTYLVYKFGKVYRK
jgi:hypothetical protein